jgi:hypothetical protein
VRTGRIIGAYVFLAAALLANGCGQDRPAKATRGTHVDIAVTAAPGSPSERHWQWFVTNVRTWAPGYVVGLVPRTPENGLPSLQAGRAGIVKADAAEAAEILPELGVLELPLLFASDAEADYVLDRHVLPELRRRFDAKGLALLALTEGEPRVGRIAWLTEARPPAEGARAAVSDIAALGTSGPSTAGPSGERVLLDSGHVPGFVLAANAWFDPLSPHDEDVFRMAYATTEARADSRAALEATMTEASRAARLELPGEDERVAVRAALEPPLSARAQALGAEAASLYAIVERGRAEFAARR